MTASSNSPLIFSLSMSFLNPNNIAHEVHKDSKKDKLKLVLTVATLAARNTIEAMVTPVVGSGGVCDRRESGCQFLCRCVGQESRFEDIFTSNLLCKDLSMLHNLYYLQI